MRWTSTPISGQWCLDTSVIRFTFWKHNWELGIPLLAMFLCALAYLLEPLSLQTARHAVFDQFQRWQPRSYQDVPVRIIDIDDASLQRLGQWPWPRTRMAELTQRLQQAGAAVIAFDMVFSEPDRTSPAAMLPLWQHGQLLSPEVRTQLEHLPDHDTELAKVLAQGRVVLGFALDRKPQSQPQRAQSKAHFVALNGAPQPFVPAFVGSVSGLPMLVAAAQGHGALSFVPDADGVVRRVPTLLRQGDALLPSLGTEAMRVALGVANVTTRSVPGIGLEELRIGALSLPTTAQGELWLHYSQPVPQRYLPAWKVLDGSVPDTELAGKILLIGASAQGLMDLRFSALGAVIPGVEIHAQLLEQMLTGDRLDRPVWADSVELLCLIVGSMLVGLVALRARALLSFGLFVVLLALLWGGAWHAFSTHQLLMDPIVPSMALVLSFVLSSIVGHVRAERRQRWVKQAFSRYVSPNLVDYLVAHPESLTLSGQRQECSFLFTDLQGFTTLMEGMDPGRTVSIINRYLDGMIAIAFAHQGTLTRIVGDGLAIMFSAPLPQADHPLRALECALEMQKFSHQYADELNAQGIAFGQTRMGVHCGEVIVGNFGGSTIFDYRALGDPINTASRLEGANRYLGTLVCVSQAVMAKCPSFAARPIGRLVLKGKSQPIMVFEPLDMTTTPDADYRQAFECMRSCLPSARAAFEQLARERPADQLVAMHLARLQRGETGDLMVLEGK